MTIVLHQDFIDDYSVPEKQAGIKKEEKKIQTNYLIDASGDLIDKTIREKIALNERERIFNELKPDILNDFEKEQSSFKYEKIQTDMCIDKELSIKNCLMEYNKIESSKQFDHLISCYDHLHAYEACINKN